MIGSFLIEINVKSRFLCFREFDGKNSVFLKHGNKTRSMSQVLIPPFLTNKKLLNPYSIS